MSTYTPITSVSLTNNTTQSVTFSSIPQTYTDLIISIGGLAFTANTTINLTFNNDTSSSYSMKFLSGNGTSPSAGSTGAVAAAYPAALYTSGAGSNLVNIQSYANTNVYKNIISLTANTTAFASGRSSIWKKTDAVTSIKLEVDVPTPYFASGTTFSLYGIDAGAALGAKATGGNIVTSDGTYWYHTFTSSGLFTPSQALTVDYLVVAGGGGGGGGSQPGGGGGGAGGYRTSIGGSTLSLTGGTVYTTLVGAGGTGGLGTATAGTGLNGNNSVFSTITSAGGGGGAGSVNTNIVTSGAGGSGGGGARPQSSPAAMVGGTGNTPSTSPSQGSNGGSGYHNPGVASLGGGGGGASATGGNAAGSTAGNGGNGTANSISGSSVTYAGGGGGGADTGNYGTGGTGGGGAGGVNGNAGYYATGGGGGGAGNYAGIGGAGGSGIVIVRYAV